MAKIPCKQCQKSITTITAEINNGLCYPCDRARSQDYLGNPSLNELAADTGLKGHTAADFDTLPHFQEGDTETILAFLDAFVEQLAQDHYADAFADLAQSPYSPDELRNAIANYFEGEKPRRVTPAADAGPPKPNQRQSMADEDDDFASYVHQKYPYCICWDRDNGAWTPLYAHADLPLNGSWDDQLTLKFDFIEHNSSYVLVIEDVEVM